MKFIFFFCLVTTGLFSCRETMTRLTARVQDADSVAINYFSNVGNDSVVSVRIVRSKDTVNLLAKLAGGKTMDASKCGRSSGTMHFFKSDQVIQDVAFRISDGKCGYFSFIFDRKWYQTEMPKEADKVLLYK